VTAASITTGPKGHQRVPGHKGITTRANGDRSKSFYVYVDELRKQGRTPYVLAGRTLKEALAKQAEIRSRRSKGEKTLVASKATFAEVAETWFEQKADRLAASSRDGYRFALDRVLLPRFRDWRIAAVDADAYAKLVRDLEREGLHAIDATHRKRPLQPASIERYLVPLQQQTVAFAARRGLIPSDPLQNLTRGDRPQPVDSEPAHEWSDEEVVALVTASEELAAKPESRYDYSTLIKTAVYTGLRQSELLGLQWRCVDLDDAVLVVEQQWARSREVTAPKTKAGTRRVPLAPHVVAMLRRHKLASKFSTETDYVFASKTGRPLGHRNVSRRGLEVHLYNRAQAEDAFRAAMGGT
jgi:integrase